MNVADLYVLLGDHPAGAAVMIYDTAGNICEVDDVVVDSSGGGQVHVIAADPKP